MQLGGTSQAKYYKKVKAYETHVYHFVSTVLSTLLSKDQPILSQDGELGSMGLTWLHLYSLIPRKSEDPEISSFSSSVNSGSLEML